MEDSGALPTPDNIGRICACCKKYKPWEMFGTQVGGRGGHASWCFACNTIRQWKSSKNTNKPAFIGTKLCPVCRETKDVTDFAMNRYESDGLSYNCKKCISKRKSQSTFSILREEKLCPKCNIVKNRSEFGKRLKTSEGLMRDCKKCRAKESADRLRDPNVYLRRIVQSLRSACKRSGMEFNISEDYLAGVWELQSGLCFYTGQKLQMQPASRDAGFEVSNNGISIDRIDSSKGYIEGNIAICCWSVNRMKSSLHIVEFISMCRDVSATWANKDVSTVRPF